MVGSGALSENAKGWMKELNKISWNGGEPKYDIRDWAPEHEKMRKGVTVIVDRLWRSYHPTVIKEENMSKKHKHISATKTTEQKAVQQSQQPQKLTLQKLNRLLEKNPFAQLLGMELLEVREGYAYGRMRMDEHFTNIYGGMHGGCSYALADTLAGVAASTYGNYVTTIDGKMNYLEAVKDTGYVYGEAEVQRQGGRIGVYTVKLMDENQKVLVTADFTYYRTGKVIDRQA